MLHLLYTGSWRPDRAPLSVLSRPPDTLFDSHQVDMDLGARSGWTDPPLPLSARTVWSLVDRPNANLKTADAVSDRIPEPHGSWSTTPAIMWRSMCGAAAGAAHM